MVLFNYATKELTAKVVYYGPGLCGKTTNLQYIYDTLPGNAKGKMLSLATKTDRTLFFDFLPIDLGKIRGMKTKIQLYTVPGQVFYDTTRKLVLKGADGVVFVADSQAAMVEANIDSYQNLATNLKEQGIELKDMPHVMQFNKRDMKNVLSVEELNDKINPHGVPYYQAVAPKGAGVFETLKGISKLVLKSLSSKYGLEEEMGAKVSAKSSAPPKPKPAPPPPQPAPPPKPAPPPPPEPAPMDEIDFVEDTGSASDFGSSMDTRPAPEEHNQTPPDDRTDHTLEPIPSLDDSEVIELDDVDPLEIEELDDMAEIASMAEDDEDEVPAPPAASSQGSVPSAATPVTSNNVEPIMVPIVVNLPQSLAGKPLRLQIDVRFE